MKNLTKQMLVNYFGGEICEINEKVITNTLHAISAAKPGWIKEINNSFLSDEMKEKYIEVLESRFQRLSI